MRPRLVLFDIDGTILSCGGVPARTLGEALREVVGSAGPIEGFEMSGKTDPQIVRELMVLDGRDAAFVDEAAPRVLERYRALLPQRLQPKDVTAKPGVLALIEALHARPEVTLGLLTGNIEPCARIKLEPLRVNPRFPFGAYGSDSADRYCLAEVAVRRAREHSGRAFAGGDVVVIGDSIHDVLCGRALGVRAVAVATGRTSRARLAEAGPEALLDDCSSLEASLEAVLG